MRDTVIVGEIMYEGDGFEIRRAEWPGLGPGYVVAVNGDDMTTFWWLSDDALIYWHHPLKVGGVADAAYLRFSLESAMPAPAYWHLRRLLARVPEILNQGGGDR